MSWKTKFETAKEQIIQVNAAEESAKASLKQEKEKLQEHLQVLRQTVLIKMKSANEAEEKWQKSETAKNAAQEDSRLAKIEAHRSRLEVVSVRKELQETRQEIDKVKEQTDLAKAQYASAFKDYAGEKNVSTAWQTKYNEMSAYAERMRQVAVAWEAEHNKLRASVDTVLGGLQANGRMGGGQMGSLTEIPGGTGQSQGHGGRQFRYIMPRPNQR
jgi:chromosome segregation ATPase